MIKIYPRFIGRLGNNLFQIAACIGYAKKYGVEWGIKKGYVERGFNAFQVDKFFPNLPACDHYFPRHQEHQNNQYCPEHQAGLDICHFNFHEIPYFPNGVEIAGFWQSWKYFQGAETEVREAFKLPVWDQYKDFVSVHIRRGDYVQHAHAFPPVTIEYIRQAMQMFLEPGMPPTRFIVCSDDIPWCRENIYLYMNLQDNDPDFDIKKKYLSEMVVFSEGHNEFEDLSIMASCKHNIISNSTLAWWGAWLNPNPDKIVVSPSHKRGNWFGHGGGIKMDCIDLIPPSWHQIEFR